MNRKNDSFWPGIFWYHFIDATHEKWYRFNNGLSMLNTKEIRRVC